MTERISARFPVKGSGAVHWRRRHNAVRESNRIEPAKNSTDPLVRARPLRVVPVTDPISACSRNGQRRIGVSSRKLSSTPSTDAQVPSST